MPSSAKVAITFHETELARFVSLLSLEAGGILLRILDIQHRTGQGLPDGKSTHLLLGLQKRRWSLLREELLRVLKVTSGHLVYTQSIACSMASEEKVIIPATSDFDSATTAAPGPRHHGVEPPVPSVSAENFDTQLRQNPPGSPIAPFEVFDNMAREAETTPNVIRHPAARKPRQPQFPGFTANEAVSAGEVDILSARKLSFDMGIALLTRMNNLSVEQARQRIGRLMRDYNPQFVYAVIADAAARKDLIADPWTWMQKTIKDFPTKKESLSQWKNQTGKPGGRAAQPRKQAPKATAEYMGLSREREARLRQNSTKMNSTQAAQNENRPSTVDPISGAIAF